MPFFIFLCKHYSGVSKNFSDGIDSTAQEEQCLSKEGSCTQDFAPMFRPVRLDAFPPFRCSSHSLSLSTLQPTEVLVQRSHDDPYALEYID